MSTIEGGGWFVGIFGVTWKKWENFISFNGRNFSEMHSERGSNKIIIIIIITTPRKSFRF